MLKAIFTKTGKTVDFSDKDPRDAVQEIVTGEPVTIYAEDVVVSASNGTIAVLERRFEDSPRVAIKHDVSDELMKGLLTLTIDDSASYDGIEEFFSDFPIRFVP